MGHFLISGMVYKNGSEGTTGSQAGWLREKKDTRLIVTGPISQEGKEFSFTFVPKADGRASINLYAFNSNGNRGIACGLNNLQKISDGEPLGGKSRAEDDFSTEDDDDYLS